MPTPDHKAKVEQAIQPMQLQNVPLAPTAAEALRLYFSKWAPQDESLQRYTDPSLKIYVTK